MDERRRRLRAYRRARRKFACIVYMVTVFWMVLALLQWLLVSLVDSIRDTFVEYYWISIICFLLAIVLVSIFIFIEKVRSVPGLNWFIALLIMELIILGIFALVARSLWADMLMFFAISVLLIFLFVLLGSIIPHDLTLDVVILFVLAFIFLIITVYFITLFIVGLWPYTFIIYQIFITIIVLLFVMYHAQTINGGRFAEMRLNDYLLATLILFHDFIIIFMLTFYMQIVYKLASGGSNDTDTTDDDDDDDGDDGSGGGDFGSGDGDAHDGSDGGGARYGGSEVGSGDAAGSGGASGEGSGRE